MKDRVNILGTEYKIIESTVEADKNLKDYDGYCDTSSKICVVDKMDKTEPGLKQNMPKYKNSVKRHELIHAFLYESGLDTCSWAQNEEMVDWLAIQSPKIFKTFTELGLL